MVGSCELVFFSSDSDLCHGFAEATRKKRFDRRVGWIREKDFDSHEGRRRDIVPFLAGRSFFLSDVESLAARNPVCASDIMSRRSRTAWRAA